MATNWVLGKISDALAPTVSGAVSSAGSFAGGAVNAVGNSINGVGDSINQSIRTYGDGAKDYGNAIMDWTKADGYRSSTANNPLGLAGGSTSGKRAVTSPQVYHPPKSSAQKLMTTNKSVTTGTQKKVVDAPVKKALPSSSQPKPVKKATTQAIKPPPTGLPKAPANKIPTGGNPGAMRRKPDAAKTTSKPATTKSTTPIKSTATTKRTGPSANPKTQQKAISYQTSKAAKDPLGLGF